MSINAEGPKSILVSNGSQTTDQQVQTSVSSIQKNSPWFQVNSPRPTAAVIKRHRATPVRSISTFNFQQARDAVSCSAPFPSIPTKQEVQNAKAAVEAKIAALKADLSSLMYEKNSIDNTVQPIIPNSSTKGIHEYRGLVITDNVIDNIIASNKEKAKEAQKDALVNVLPESIPPKHTLPKFRHIGDLPEFKQTVNTQSEILVPLFAIRFGEKDVLEQKKLELVDTYLALDEPYKHTCELIDEYNARTGEKSEHWPPEFTFDRAPADDVARLKWVAQDTPMILSKKDKIERAYYDTNSYVANPEETFEGFKNRLAWTEDERQTFVEKYRQHTKDFAKIAEALPEKTVKDVIEFYYLNRYHMNLKENEAASKRRGGKKKVITEGTNKKNY